MLTVLFKPVYLHPRNHNYNAHIMKVNSIYLESNSTFSNYITDWANTAGVTVIEYDHKSEELPEGLLLINANQDIERDHVEIYDLFDKKHIPTQKIDVNGTLQVAVSNLEMWLNNFKCKHILILGSESLIKNDNLDRFFNRISK